MSDQSNQPQDEFPNQRFRRLISESEEIENADDNMVEQDREADIISESDQGEEKAETLNPSEEESNSTEDNVDVQFKALGKEPDLSEYTVIPLKPKPNTSTNISTSQTRKTPLSSPPAIDTQGLPLPKRIDEIDTEATRVSTVAYQSQRNGEIPPPPMTQPTPRSQHQKPPAGQVKTPVERKPRKKKPPLIHMDWKQGLGCVVKSMIAGLFIIVILGLLCFFLRLISILFHSQRFTHYCRFKAACLTIRDHPDS